MTCPRPAARLLCLVLAWACLFLSGPWLTGAEVTRSSFSIPGGDAALTLRQLSRQARESVVFPIDLVHGVQTHPVQGDFTAREAAERMVAGTELFVSQDIPTGALTISRRARPESELPEPQTANTAPMKPAKSSGLLSLLAGWFYLASADAQATTAARVPTRDEVVALSPFEVNTSRDTSYGALNSTSISAFNTELLKTPVAADIFTQDFMRDMATTNVEELLAGYGAGAGTVLRNLNDTDIANNQPGDRTGISQLGSRGVTAGLPRRDGFAVSSTNASINDTFDTERVEVVKGANAMLFGASGAGGLVSIGSKRARFRSGGQPVATGSATSRIDQYGSKRSEFDANYGLKHIAFRFVLMNDEKSYRRLFIGGRTVAFYAALSARLPFNTTLHLSGRKTDNDRILPTSTNDLSFTNATRDPRHNFSLPYLLATNQAGAVNPKTGTAYPGGAIANGKLSWENAWSWGGWAAEEDITTANGTLIADTVWTKWLSTSFGAMYDFATTQVATGASLFAPRAFNNANPLDDWAAASNFAMNRNNNTNDGRRYAYRANAVITNDLLRGRGKSQTVIGYDRNFKAGIGSVTYRYYEADSNFRIYSLENPRPAAAANTIAADQLGRFAMPQIYWPVGGGPVKKPYFKPGSRQITVAGRNYVLEQQNPRNPNFVSSLNPLGQVSLVPGLTGIGGANLGNYAERANDSGLYGANYTSWFQDRFTTLLGYRWSNTFTRRPNTSATGTAAWTETDKDSSSYNLGLTYRLKPWLYAYGNMGHTFNPALLNNNPYGEPPADTTGRSREFGLKYEPANACVSGSIAYYFAESEQENFNYGIPNRDLINPVGLNDAFNAAQRNQWVPVDKESSGLEIIVTAAPTRNWRARLGFTQQAGKIKAGSSFRLLWNDEFYYNKTTGGVTYSDGTAFMVPTDAAGIATVNSTNTLRAPVVGATNSQLTVAMMSDPSNPYYAYGQGGTMNPNGRITANSVVYRALRWFQIPGGGQIVQARTLRTGLPLSAIPYAYDDPAGLNGVAVVTSAGEPTVGQPLYRFVCTNAYDITEGWLKGTTLGATARWDIDKRTYYYAEPDGRGGNTRKLFKEGNVNPQVSGFIAYHRKIGRYQFRTQMNVDNLFNRYKVEVRPSTVNGYAVEDALSATFVGQPRLFVWTNSVSF
jgi:outer membrane receptor for ferric coprogen and ferric-rhodotorulic acid